MIRLQLEQRFLLLETSQSAEANKSFLSEINKYAKGYYIPSLSHYLSNRSEKNLSVTRYDSDLSTMLNKAQVSNVTREFYLFHLNRFNIKQYGNLTDLLTQDNYHSVVDRYISVCFVIKTLLCSEDNSDEQHQFLKTKLHYLFRKFQDPQLASVFTLQFGRNHKLLKSKIDTTVQDLFVSGLYQDCISKLKSLLDDSPLTIDYYILYVSCHLYSNKTFEYLDQKSSFQNSILKAIYEQLNRMIAPVEATINLQRIIKNLSAFNLSDGLHRFLNDENRVSLSWKQYDNLSFDIDDPDIVDFYKKKTSAELYLTSLYNLNPNSVSINLKRIRNTSNYDESLTKLNLPPIVEDIEKARFNQGIGNFDVAKDIWTNVTH